jgi:uncharacterized protein YndB with AHSA1/START domain
MKEEPGVAVRTGMLVRRPVSEVFRAIVDPDVTGHFWFTRGSGELTLGQRVRWEWEMYGVQADVDVAVVEKNRRIALRWPHPAGEGQANLVWEFEPVGDDLTFVTVITGRFRGETADVAATVADAIEGFTLVLAGMKAWLEHGMELNLVADRRPPSGRR